jgi:hypothetical protein
MLDREDYEVLAVLHEEDRVGKLWCQRASNARQNLGEGPRTLRNASDRTTDDVAERRSHHL